MMYTCKSVIDSFEGQNLSSRSLACLMKIRVEESGPCIGDIALEIRPRYNRRPFQLDAIRKADLVRPRAIV